MPSVRGLRQGLLPALAKHYLAADEASGRSGTPRSVIGVLQRIQPQLQPDDEAA
jgi:hypothetical protein